MVSSNFPSTILYLLLEGWEFFARSANKMAVTVNFSDLVIYEVLP